MFDVVMFLIENYTGNGMSFITDKEAVSAELERVGFPKLEIDRALDWLDGLDRVQKAAEAGPGLTGQAFRHYLPYEEEHFGVDGIGFLVYLEQLGILDARTREVVIDRLMALDKHEVDISRIQWVVLVALFNQPEKKPVLSILQDLILSDAFGQLH